MTNWQTNQAAEMDLSETIERAMAVMSEEMSSVFT